MHSLIFVSWLKPLSFIHLENDNDDNLPEDGCGLGAQNTNMLSHQLCDPENKWNICETSY